MPDHKVQFSIPYRELGRADIIFKVFAQETKTRWVRATATRPRRKKVDEEENLIGTLLVSHGAIEWRSRKKQNKVKLGWSDFDRWMLERRARK